MVTCNINNNNDNNSVNLSCLAHIYTGSIFRFQVSMV